MSPEPMEAARGNKIPSRKSTRRTARPHTGLWSPHYIRYPGSRLRSGAPTAHGAVRLVLLGSPPDTVHGASLRGTDPSSLLTGVRQHSAGPGAGIHPCCSGLQVQGTANSPTSAALPHAAARLVVIVLHFRKIINPLFCPAQKSPPHRPPAPSERPPPGSPPSAPPPPDSGS